MQWPEPTPLNQDCYRCCDPDVDPMSPDGAQKTGNRFNPPDLPTLYLASTPQVALAESIRADRAGRLPAFAPRLLVCVRTFLTGVLDLTDYKTQRALDLTKKDFVGEWNGDEFGTQALGLRAAEAGFEAVLFPSRVDRLAMNLAVFTENVRESSLVRLVEADEVAPQLVRV